MISFASGGLKIKTREEQQSGGSFISRTRGFHPGPSRNAGFLSG